MKVVSVGFQDSDGRRIEDLDCFIRVGSGWSDSGFVLQLVNRIAFAIDPKGTGLVEREVIRTLVDRFLEALLLRGFDKIQVIYVSDEPIHVENPEILIHQALLHRTGISIIVKKIEYNRGG
jgi:hypothetical protein